VTTRATIGTLLLPIVALCLTGCAADPPRTERTSTPSTTTTPSAAATPEPSLEEYVAEPDAVLSGARVRRTDDGFLVVASWIVERPGRRAKRILVTSDDGFRTATYEKYTQKRFFARIPFPDHPEPDPPSDGLLVSPTTSLVPGTAARVLGGDGATLFPFERTARSTDGGRTWTTFDVDEVDGQRAYVTGSVVLADGRQLVNLTNWSGDRRHRPSKVHHGLWISDGDDWGSFAPYEPPFDPPIDKKPQEWPAYSSLEATVSPSGSVIWTSLPDGQLYVSTDDGVTFTRIPAR
jgi:hypothetical protein